jgi:hypothetical protein
MQRRILLTKLGLTALAGMIFSPGAGAADSPAEKCALRDGEIQHMVIFNLKHEKGSAEARKFIQDGTRILTGIPVVQNFQSFSQISPKNKYSYGFSMVFANREDYATYNSHSAHVAFVQDRWMKEVSEFLEIDFGKTL